MKDIFALPLDPYVVAGWTPTNGAAYYVHNNSVWLSGSVVSGDAATVNVLTGLPAAICPADDVSVTLVLMLGDTFDPATPGIAQPVQLAATVTPAGDVTLTTLPPFAATTPNGTLYNIGGEASGILVVGASGTYPDFTEPLTYVYSLGAVTWPLDDPGTDSFPTESLAPYLARGDVADIDATIGISGSRVILSGQVLGVGLGSYLLTDSLPFTYTDGLGTLGLDGAVSVVQNPRFPAALVVSPFGNTIESDLPAPLPAPPQWPPLTAGTGIVYSGHPGGQSTDNGTIRSFIAGLQVHPNTFSNDPASLPAFGGSAGLGMYGVGPGWGRLTRTYDFGDTGLDGEDVGLPFIEGCINVISFDLTYECDGVECPDVQSGSITIDLTDQIGAYYPAPDWIAVMVNPFNAGEGFYNDSTIQAIQNHTLGCGTDPGTCGPWNSDIPSLVIQTDVSDCRFVDMGLVEYASGSFDGEAEPFIGSGVKLWDFTPASVAGGLLLQRPDAGMLYDKDPNNLAATCLWRPDELTFVTASIDGVGPGQFFFAAFVVPFWEARSNFMLPGDVTDLGGAGWPAAPVPPPPTPTNIDAGEGLSGIVRRS